MKLTQFYKNGSPALGIWTEAGTVDVSAAAAKAGVTAPATMMEAIRGGDEALKVLPGDLIFTGTPEGVMKGWPADKQQWLKPGDRVEVSIEGIGTLSNTLI